MKTKKRKVGKPIDPVFTLPHEYRYLIRDAVKQHIIEHPTFQENCVWCENHKIAHDLKGIFRFVGEVPSRKLLLANHLRTKYKLVLVPVKK
jgi:hypothetical protein